MSGQLSLLGVEPPAIALPPWEDIISPCGLYRYWLRVPFADTGPTCLVVMFNSSTATKDDPDPTLDSVRRIVPNWRPGGVSFGAVEIVNLHGFRSAEPKDLLGLADPVGPDNAKAVAMAIPRASHVIAGWGGLVMAHRDYQRRADEMEALLRQHHPTIYCFKQNKNGTPTHPLYLAAKTTPSVYAPERP